MNFTYRYACYPKDGIVFSNAYTLPGGDYVNRTRIATLLGRNVATTSLPAGYGGRFIYGETGALIEWKLEASLSSNSTVNVFIWATGQMPQIAKEDITWDVVQPYIFA